MFIVFGAFVLLGLVDGAFGTVWPDLRDDFSRGDSSFGIVFSMLAAGYLVASVASGHLSERIGTGYTITLGTASSVVAFATVALSPSWVVVLVGFALGGLGSGLIDATANTWVAVTQGARQMGMLHGFYGIGAVVGPLVATAFVVGAESWRGVYVVVFGLQVLLLITFVARRAIFDTDTRTSPADATHAARPRAKVIAVAMLVWFSLYVGVEVSVGGWAFTLLTEGRGVGEVLAGVLSAAFWFGLMAGRFVYAAIDDRVPPERLQRVAGVTTIAALLVFWLDPVGAGGFALPFVGLSLAVMFPIAVGRTPVYLGTDRAGRAVGYQLATSSLGGIVMPAVIGVFADRRGVTTAAPILLVAALAMVVAWTAIQRLAVEPAAAP